MKRFIATMLMLSCAAGPILLPTQIEAAQQSRTHKPRSKANVTRNSADLEKRRERVHRLILAGKYQPEDIAELLEIGDRTSIPVLLKVLKDNPAFVRANGRVILPLKTAYAVETLRKIAGLNMGVTYNEWNDWWEKNQKYYAAK